MQKDHLASSINGVLFMGVSLSAKRPYLLFTEEQITLLFYMAFPLHQKPDRLSLETYREHFPNAKGKVDGCRMSFKWDSFESNHIFPFLNVIRP